MAKERGADAEERRIERDVAALVGPGDAVREQPQARHIGGRDARARAAAGTRPRSRSRRRPGRSPRRRGRRPAHRRGTRGVRRRDRSARWRATRWRRSRRRTFPPTMPACELEKPPRVAQLGQQRGVGREAQHRQDVGDKQDKRRLCAVRRGNVIVYLFLKIGLRFSRKAAMPSFWSSSANCDWNTRRSNSTPSASEVS